MDVHDQRATETKQPPSRAPFQFGLKHVLAAPVWLALMLSASAMLGMFGAVLFILLSCLVISVWYRAWGCVVLVLAMALFVLLTLPAVDGGEAPPRACCANNLKQIGLALHNYHSDYGCFPPAYIADENGRPMHSWRVLILPYLEQKPLYAQYDFSEPWDGPNNRKLHGIDVFVYGCPSDRERAPRMTNYLAVVGPATAWPGTDSTRLVDFSDGMSSTILVVEVHNSGVHWMEPRDLHVVQMAPGVNSEAGQGISSAHEGGANVLFADGSVRFLPDDVLRDVFEALLTIDGGETVPAGF